MWILWRDQKVTLSQRVSHVSAALWFNAICCTHSPLCWQGVIIDFLWSLGRKFCFLDDDYKGEVTPFSFQCKPCTFIFPLGPQEQWSQQETSSPYCCWHQMSFLPFPRLQCGRTWYKGPTTKRQESSLRNRNVRCPTPYKRLLEKHGLMRKASLSLNWKHNQTDMSSYHKRTIIS